VVARSGVAKSTVYRHWATRDELVAAVFANCAPKLEAPDPSLGFEPALRALAHHFVTLLNDEQWKRFLPALLILKSQKDAIAELNGEMEQQQTVVIASVLELGVVEGVLRPEVLDDLDATMTLLVGPVLMAGLVDSVPLDEAFADRAVDQFLAAQRLGAPSPA
jgi:AcrR family transcriptional regulator